MKRIFVFLAMSLLGLRANAQMNVDMTTGKDDITGAQLGCGSDEDSWELFTGSGWIWPVVTDGVGNVNPPQQVWALPHNSNGKWVNAKFSCQLFMGPQASSYHQYKRTFDNNAGCSLTNARFEIDAIGADNAIHFEFNNTSVQYHVNSSLSTCAFTVDNYTSLHTNIVIPINSSDIVPGVNELRAHVCNADRSSGMYISGRLKGDYIANLMPSIATSPRYCGGAPVTVTGSNTGTGTVDNHYWEILESDAVGNIAANGYNWSGWYAGTPGTFTFPNSASWTCGKYYRIKLALQNECTPWVEQTKIIFDHCPPAPVISGPSSVCSGQSATYCVTNPVRGEVYTWSTGASTSCTTISPTSSTTLTLNATRLCSSTVSFPVTVLNTNPDFNLATSFNSPYAYYTSTATPVVTTGLPPGFGFWWRVEEVNATNTAIPGTDVLNPFVWLPSLTTSFCGYDGFNNNGYNGTSTLNCSAPPVGQFVNGHRYRITRGTWSTACSWQQTSKLIYMCTNCRGGNTIIVDKDSDAPSYEHLLVGGQQQLRDAR